MQSNKPYFTRLLSLLTGAAYVTIFYKIPALGNVGIVGVFAISALVMVPVTLALTAFPERKGWLLAPLILLGATIGIMVDVILDTKRDRNLFPLEIAFVWAVLCPAVVAGSTLGWWLRRGRI